MMILESIITNWPYHCKICISLTITRVLLMLLSLTICLSSPKGVLKPNQHDALLAAPGCEISAVNTRFDLAGQCAAETGSTVYVVQDNRFNDRCNGWQLLPDKLSVQKSSFSLNIPNSPSFLIYWEARGFSWLSFSCTWNPIDVREVPLRVPRVRSFTTCNVSSHNYSNETNM